MGILAVMLVRMQLALPRDARYVGMMRQVADCVMSGAGAPPGAVADVQLALSEACANVVRHAVGSEEYQVEFDVAEDRCEIEVSDQGPGLSPETVRPAPLERESGRGLLLMAALTDDVRVSTDGDGTQVRLVKSWATGSQNQASR